jgi:acetyltransferase
MAYADLTSLLHVSDLAVVCTPAASVPDLIDQCGRIGIFSVVTLSVEFRETGPDGRLLCKSGSHGASLHHSEGAVR